MASFAKIQTNNKHEMVAASLEEAILCGSLKVGEKLPSEQSLADQFGVSRNIMREAMRNVKARGLLEVKNGDGSYITKPKSTDLSDMMNRFMVLNDLTIRDYFEIRSVLEVKACELAALRATEEDIENLENIVCEMRSNLHVREKVALLDFKFHQTIASVTKNPLFSSLLQPLKSIMINLFDYAYSARALEETKNGHMRIIEALREKNPELARAAMTRHIEVSESNLTLIAQQTNDTERQAIPDEKTPAVQGTREKGS
jgi:GntR family transcriptional repressor for pyruvate dehydrogenase complex